MQRSADGTEGVTPLDHTADVGFAVRAPSRTSLFDRAATAMRELIEGASEKPATDAPRQVRSVEVAADEAGALLVAWLRELLYLHQVERLAYRSAAFERAGETSLRADVTFAAAATRPVREIKGVTYHGLALDREADGWRARVIFDV